MRRRAAVTLALWWCREQRFAVYRCSSEVVCSLGRKPLLLPEPAMVTPAGAAYLLGGIAVMVTSPSRLLGKPMFLVRPERPMAALFASHSFLKASAWWIVWWLLTAGWTVVVARPACAGVLGEAIRV